MEQEQRWQHSSPCSEHSRALPEMGSDAALFWPQTLVLLLLPSTQVKGFGV